MATAKTRHSTARLTRTDLALLAHVVRFRYLTVEQMRNAGPVAGMPRSSAYRKVARLEAMGLILRRRPITAAHGLIIPTQAAYDLVGSPLHPETAVTYPTINHTLAVGDVAGAYLNGGYEIRSEREIAQAVQNSRKPGQRARRLGTADGPLERLWIVLPPSGKQHAPDLVVLAPQENGTVLYYGVEVELTAKPQGDIAAVLRGFIEAPNFVGVTYVVTSEVVRQKILTIAGRVLDLYTVAERKPIDCLLYMPIHSPKADN
jgi:hypothetical protein